MLQIYTLLIFLFKVCIISNALLFYFNKPSKVKVPWVFDKKRPSWTTTSLPQTNEDSTSSLSPLPIGGGLARALSHLDNIWETSSKKNRPWRKVYLNVEQKTQDSSTADVDFVHILENPQPDVIILFTGGTLLGQYSHITYGYFLENLSRNLNATIIASSYTVSLDHWSLARKNLKLFQRALISFENENLPLSIPSIPIFMISHSLGAKLNILSNAASPEFEFLVRGHFILSFNNFGFSETISMMNMFTREFMVKNEQAVDSPSWFEMLIDLTRQTFDLVGLEFTPSPEETLRVIEKKYTREIQSKTHLLVFENDSLDCSSMFMKSCHSDNSTSTTTLPGTHLTPVFINFDVNDAVKNLGDNDERWLSSLLGGFRGASFGNETQTKTLVETVTKLIKSKL